MNPDREDDGLYDIEALQHRVREVMAANDAAMNPEFGGRSSLDEETAPLPTHEGGPLRLGNGRV